MGGLYGTIFLYVVVRAEGINGKSLILVVVLSPLSSCVASPLNHLTYSLLWYCGSSLLVLRTLVQTTGLELGYNIKRTLV